MPRPCLDSDDGTNFCYNYEIILFSGFESHYFTFSDYTLPNLTPHRSFRSLPAFTLSFLDDQRGAA
jgi:hypothetical protein